MEWCIHDSFYRKHHFIYKEELKKDDEKKKKVDCSWCHMPIWGSSYNCVECGNQPVHMSSNEHCLDFTEKLETDGNKKVYCFGCDEPVLGAAYKCSISECSFLIHKSCTELSYHINHHLHPNHTLSLQPLNKNRCDTCCRSHDRSFFYRCTSCSFKLDIKCSHNPLSVNPNDCHQHEFFYLGRQIQFNCDACGEEITNLAYRVCSICKLLVHYRCAEIPRKVKIKLHNHILNLIYSLPEIKKHDDTFCRICYEKVNIKYAAYYCQECSYIFHTECLRRFRNMYGELPITSESVPNKSVGHATHLIKALNQAEDEGPHLEEIQHFSHQQHKLIIYRGEVKNDKLCEGCMELIISAPFYTVWNVTSLSTLDVLNFPQGLSNTDLIYFTHSTSSHGHLPRVVCSFVIYVLVIIVASPTNATHVLGAKPLTFNAVQFQKSLNMKVINILFTLL
jgi:hypothetical protein